MNPTVSCTPKDGKSYVREEQRALPSNEGDSPGNLYSEMLALKACRVDMPGRGISRTLGSDWGTGRSSCMEIVLRMEAWTDEGEAFLKLIPATQDFIPTFLS